MATSIKRKKITVADLAREAHVSPATVSRVLNKRYDLVTDATVNSVKAAMEKLGYEIPESIKVKTAARKEKPTILINIPDGNLFYSEVIHGAISSAYSHGFNLLTSRSPLDAVSLPDYLQMLRQLKVAGVIVLNPLQSDLLLQINEVAPVVQCSEFDEESGLPFVSIRNEKAAREATEYLISQGRNKIALINGPAIYRYSRERRQGFVEAIENAYLTIPRNWIVNLPEINYDMAYAAICQILNADPIPNAFFAVSDTLASAVVKAAHAFHYKIPEDIMLIGFDNTEFSYASTPSITTVNQPRFQEGFTACEMLITRIMSPEITISPIFLDTELVLRETTG